MSVELIDKRRKRCFSGRNSIAGVFPSGGISPVVSPFYPSRRWWPGEPDREPEETKKRPIAWRLFPGYQALYVQGVALAYAASSLPRTVSLRGPVTKGNLLVLFVGTSGTTSTLNITDTSGNVYRQVDGYVGSSVQGVLSMWYAIAKQSTPSLTVTASLAPTAKVSLSAAFLEYSGIDPINPLDSFNSSTATNTANLTTNTITCSQPGELVVGGFSATPLVLLKFTTTGGSTSELSRAAIGPLVSLFIADQQTSASQSSVAITGNLSAFTATPLGIGASFRTQPQPTPFTFPIVRRYWPPIDDDIPPPSKQLLSPALLSGGVAPPPAWFPTTIRQMPGSPDPDILPQPRPLGGALLTGQVAPPPMWQPFASKVLLPLADPDIPPAARLLAGALFPGFIPPVTTPWFPFKPRMYPDPAAVEFYTETLRRLFPTSLLPGFTRPLTPILLGAGLVCWDPKASKRTRQHQQLVAEILNSLMETSQLARVDFSTWVLQFITVESQAWAGTPPTSIADALDRIAVALAALGHQP